MTGIILFLGEAKSWGGVQEGWAEGRDVSKIHGAPCGSRFLQHEGRRDIAKEKTGP